MNDINDEKDKKIEELEHELARIKGEVVITEEIFKGHPVLSFSGAFRPFSLGMNKCKVVLKSIDKIRSFVEKHDNDR
ncbi:MAG TPA: hypothetical protein ENI15_00660 [Spirochaetes bacterium]|nr:hypothetical protein [Spirochaetota bacterium]